MLFQISFENEGSITEFALIFSLVLMHAEVLQNVLLLGEGLVAAVEPTLETRGISVCVLVENSEK